MFSTADIFFKLLLARGCELRLIDLFIILYIIDIHGRVEHVHQHLLLVSI